MTCLRPALVLVSLIIVLSTFPTKVNAKPPLFSGHSFARGANYESGSTANEVTAAKLQGPYSCGAGALQISHAISDGAPTGLSAPDGWTLIDLQNGPAFTSSVWWKVLGENEPSIAFTWNEPESMVFLETCYIGFSTSEPIGNVAAANENSAAPFAPDVQVEHADSVVARLFAADEDRYFTVPNHTTFIAENDEGVSVAFRADYQTAAGMAGSAPVTFVATEMSKIAPCCEQPAETTATDWRAISVVVNPSQALLEVNAEFADGSRGQAQFTLDCSDDDFDQQGTVTGGASPQQLTLTGFWAGQNTCSLSAAAKQGNKYKVSGSNGCDNILIEDGQSYNCTFSFAKSL